MSPDGTISIPKLDDWANGDLGQRAAQVLAALVDYYMYTGDPAAIAHLTWQSDFLLDYCQTDESHPWPKFLISVPNQGKPYSHCDPRGFIQLDTVAQVGIGLVRAYKVTGNKRWLNAAKHWADLLADHCDRKPGASPWNRYANPEVYKPKADDVAWTAGKDNKMTGGICSILFFLDDLIQLGYHGKDNKIVSARDAGRVYLRDILLPAWATPDTWGRNFWDNVAAYQDTYTTGYAARYLMANKDYFPNWRNDVRNIVSLYLNSTSVNLVSEGEVYSGAWAFPESIGCCGRSLWYAPMETAMLFAQYSAETGSEWAKEIARRQQILTTYDIHETGWSEDDIDGGQIVNSGWFKIAHPATLRLMLETIAWIPDVMGASRENHIVRSSGVVNSVVYGNGKIEYTTFDAPTNTHEVLRLAFMPTSVKANGKALGQQGDQDNLKENGYAVRKLSNGDCLVTVRHDGRRRVEIEGVDPQQMADDGAFTYEGSWDAVGKRQDFGGGVHVASGAGSSARISFTGNQVRLIGRADEQGGLADVYLDGVKQLVGIDCYNPGKRHQQVLYYKNGLENGKHELKVVARGWKNPYAKGGNVYVDAVQWSEAAGSTGFGEGGGPTDTQRLIFGYTGRKDHVDSLGNSWRPGTEFVSLIGVGHIVPTSWWTEPVKEAIAGTADQELYRYGVHAKDFTVNLTVGPGRYHVRLKFAATHGLLDPKKNCVTILINGQYMVRRMDVAATAGSPNKAVDLVFNGITPRNGMIDVRFVGGGMTVPGEAFVQAIEVGPGDGGKGAVPIRVPTWP